MKTQLNYFGMATFLLLSSCAKSPLSDDKATYQMKGSKILAKYANSISRGFTTSPSSSRGVTSQWQQQNGNVVMNQSLTQEAQDCVNQSNSVPKNTANLQFMASNLARCLNKIISYRNPLYTAGYRNLNPQGQQYWTYLLDWRRPAPVQQFSPNDFTLLNNYASTGYLNNNLTQ